MELYLLIGLFIGMIMVGVYWALPVAITGPKSLGRVVLILATAPFIWPIQVTFYAVRFFFRGKSQDAA